MKDNPLIDQLIDLIIRNHGLDYGDIRDQKYFEDKRVPGQYAIRVFIGKDSIDFAIRHAIPGKTFDPDKDIVETNFIGWPPASIQFNEIFSYVDK